MKKLLSIAAAVCMSFTLAACSGSAAPAVDKNEEEAKEIITSFFTALQEGDIEKANTFANEDVVSELSKITESFSQLEDMLDQYGADDETKAKFTSIIPLFMKSVFEKQEFVETEKVTDTAYAFKIKNTGVNVEALNNVDQAFDTDAFLNENMDELTEKAQSEGYDAAMSWMMGKLGDYMIENLNTYISDQAKEDNELNCTVEKVDDKWTITKLQ